MRILQWAAAHRGQRIMPHAAQRAHLCQQLFPCKLLAGMLQLLQVGHAFRACRVACPDEGFVRGLACTCCVRQLACCYASISAIMQCFCVAVDSGAVLRR